MKKLFAIIAMLVLVVTLSACKNEPEKGTFTQEDGIYFAATEDFNHGYRYWVTVEIENGFVVDAEWNAYQLDGGAGSCEGNDKYACSELGLYGMNGAKGKWYEQVDSIIDWFIDEQKVPGESDFNDDGQLVDTVSTVTIHTNDFFALVEEALDSDPVPEGNYESDFYYFETAKENKTVTYGGILKDTTTTVANVTETFETYTFATFVVVNGTIVIADFNAAHDAYIVQTDASGAFIKTDNPDPEGRDFNTIVYVEKDGSNVPEKKFVTKDAAGTWYGMSQTGNEEWDVQAAYVEDELLTEQTLTITTEGAVDGVTGATIHTEALAALFQEIPTK